MMHGLTRPGCLSRPTVPPQPDSLLLTPACGLTEMRQALTWSARLTPSMESE